jgi:hypothetical protein
MATLDEKKIKLQTRVRNIVRAHHENHSTLMNLQAQANSETLITLIESCKKHNQLEICKQYIDQFQTNPTVEVPDFL